MAADAEVKLEEAVNLGLADDDAHVLREEVAREIPRRLSENGQRLLIHHWLGADAAGAGFATASQLAADLGEGARQLYAAQLWYPGAALVRQLIECGYLLSLMADDRKEAEAWMTSTHDEIRSKFTPGRMRKRTTRNFRQTEYESHCDLGGHPNPQGNMLLRNQVQRQPVSLRIQWVDLAQHLSEIWASFEAALSLYDPRMMTGDQLYSPARSPDGGEEVKQLLAQWQRHDPLAHRLDLPNPDANARRAQ